MEKTQIRGRLEQLEPGAKINIRLADGTSVEGTFNGIEGDQVHLEGADDVEVDNVENVLMDISTDGDE